jgi:hypothetical protein
VLLVEAGPLAAAGLIAAANLAMVGLYYLARIAERRGRGADSPDLAYEVLS